MSQPFFILYVALSIAGTLLASGQSHAQGDANAGAKIYLKCRSCHVLDQPTNKMGPHLVEVFGRKAGTVEGYKYSDAMKEAGENGLVWNQNTLKEFLKSPKTMIPGTTMRFWGLWENQIDDLNAYLSEKVTGEPAAQ